jgi:serine/threonine-protein kinase
VHNGGRRPSLPDGLDEVAVEQGGNAIEKGGVSEQLNVEGPVGVPSVARLESGARLGKYELERRLGAGSMGAVYEAVRAADGARFAIKVLNAELTTNPVARARFLKEADLASRVRHPSIVDIIETGEEAGQVYLVMELLEGEDLARRLQRTGAMPVPELVDILVPVCEAVATAHKGGITHRDLKPANIFLAVRGDGDRPIVLDFGVAKDDQEPGASEASTQTTGVVFGAPMYLAPELVADYKAAGPLSDQYALGVILYEALTGSHPFEADSVPHLLRAISAANAPSPRERRSDIPIELDAIVLRAMSADPLARYRNVEDLRRALLPFASAAERKAEQKAEENAPAEKAPLGRRRPPSSPAIEVEAATPSPFVRTLAPELQTDSHLSVAPAVPQEVPGERSVRSLGWPKANDHQVQSQPDLAEEQAGGRTTKDRPAAPAGSDAPGEDLSLSPAAWSALAGVWRTVTSAARERRRIVVAAGVALGGFALLFIVRGGHSDREAAAVSATAAPVIAAPAPPPPPPPVTAPAAPVQTAARVETAPAPAPLPAASPPPPVAPASPPAAAAIAPSVDPPAPTSPPRARAVHYVAAPAHAPAPTRTPAAAPAHKAAVVRSSPPAPRTHDSAEVRMHNGVPLLD